jgi:hypothetical protein
MMNLVITSLKAASSDVIGWAAAHPIKEVRPWFTSNRPVRLTAWDAARAQARRRAGDARFVRGRPPASLGEMAPSLVMRKYHGLGYREIAADLRTSEGAARANVPEALRKLKECFGDCI